MWTARVTWHDTKGHAEFACHTARDAERFRNMSHAHPHASCMVVFDPGPERPLAEFARGV